ncbi:MAG: sugar transferase [Erythrobacter sp.]
MRGHQRILKRGFDVMVAGIGLLLGWPVIVVTALLARRNTGASGIFRQQRIGRHAKPFTVYKIRTMRAVDGTSVTTAGDARITALGAKLRRLKLDELPQLWNVLKGDMSFVGPRPDVAGFADALSGDDRAVLELRPGITGPATLKYRDEETILAGQADPERYNRDVIWPDKVAINLSYLENYRFLDDLALIWRTATGR